jgi:hypothetical protein
MTRRPSAGTVGDGFGMRWHPIAHEWRHHDGEDIGHDAGLTLVAPMRAQLVSYTNHPGWGRLVTLRDGDTTIRLAHTELLANLVMVGDWMDEGEPVAVMGDTGLAAGVHVHWEVLVNGRLVDPAGWLASTAGGNPEPFPPSTTNEGEEDMSPRQIHTRTKTGKVIRALCVPGTGYFVKWSESGATYANNIAKGFDTGSSVEVTESMFGVFEREAIAMRPKDALSIELAEA